MTDLTSDVPKIPGVVSNTELPAQQDSARKETDPPRCVQSTPPEAPKQNQEAEPPNVVAGKDDNPEVDARNRANRINAQKSTGAKTPEGRAASSKNAIKHGLFAADITQYFRTDEESQRYQRFVDGIVKDIEPVGDFENVLARRAADIQFRLEMLRTAEFKIYAGNTGLMNDTMEELLNRSGNPMGLASLYDSRFQRAFSKTMEDLRRAQQSRRDKELHALEQLKGIALAHIQQDTTFDPAKFGFVISRDFIFNQAHLFKAKMLAQLSGGDGRVEKKVVDYVAKVPPKAA